MTPEEIRAILTISLLAAYADSHKHEREREEIRRIAEGLAQSEEVNLPSLYQDVLLKRTNLATAAAALTSAESRELAYEMAVCVCDADGETSAAERAFLQSLRAALKLDELINLLFALDVSPSTSFLGCQIGEERLNIRQRGLVD